MILPSRSQSDFLKLIGAFSMLIDHLGAFLFPKMILLRILGRISFPIFAYQLTVGFRKTANLKGYLKRLFIFGSISQIPFSILEKKLLPLNVLFTFTLGILILYFLERKKYFLAVLLVLFSPLSQWGFYGTFLILGFYFFNSFFLQFLILISASLFSFFSKNYIQSFVFISFPFLILRPKINFRMPKYFFYWFYPIHLTIILILKLIFFQSKIT